MTLQEFFSLWPLFQNATITGTVLGGALGILGVHVILRRMVFLTAAVSQSASLGVVLAVFLAGGTSVAWIFNPTVGAFLMTLACLWFVQRGRRSTEDQSDALLGVMYLVGAAGTILLASYVDMELQDLNVMLFGSSVAVLREDFLTALVICAVVVTFQLWWWRGIIATTLDPQSATVRGLPVRWLNGVLLVSLALVIAQSTRILGPLPTFAFSTLPAFAALRLSKNIPEALLFAGVLGGLAGFGGYVVATLADTSVGATQTMVGVVLWMLAEGLGRVRRAWRRTQWTQSQSSAP